MYHTYRRHCNTYRRHCNTLGVSYVQKTPQYNWCDKRTEDQKDTIKLGSPIKVLKRVDSGRLMKRWQLRALIYIINCSNTTVISCRVSEMSRSENHIRNCNLKFIFKEIVCKKANITVMFIISWLVYGQWVYRGFWLSEFNTNIQGGSNMTGTDLCVNNPHCAAAVRPWEWSHNLHPPSYSG